MTAASQSTLAPGPGIDADDAARQDDFAADFRRALAETPHRISPKHFYDDAGSRLFDRICLLPEYYPTRTELAILAAHADEVAALAGPGAELIEFGAGSLRKAGLLLARMQRPSRYLPIDISGPHLQAAARRIGGALAEIHPGLRIEPLVADFTGALQLPPAIGGGAAGRRIGFFPGSTIGNFEPAQALAFLRRAAAVLRGGALLLGTDLVKPVAILDAAYNDREGVTAAFNLNLLVRANRELGTDFVLPQWRHHAFWSPRKERIEMHLVSRVAQRVHLDGTAWPFAEGETIHTENSHKYTLAGSAALAREAGFVPRVAWTDAERLFAVQWWDVA